MLAIVAYSWFIGIQDLTAHNDILKSETNKGVLSHPEIQCISNPPSPKLNKITHKHYDIVALGNVSRYVLKSRDMRESDLVREMLISDCIFDCWPICCKVFVVGRLIYWLQHNKGQFAI